MSENDEMRSGFSLLELSIVLVIIGLLAGGVMTGQSLIRAAELRAVSTDYQRYTTALQAFRDKYMALPGDFNSGTRFWGRAVADASCVTNSGAAVATPGTCDGNGDGRPTNSGTAAVSGEVFQFWKQLALAGMIEGSYTGNAGPSADYDTLVGSNVPASRIPNVGWYVQYLGVYGGSPAAYAIDYGTYFQVGGQVAGNVPYDRFLRPEEAWNIDTKMDDGKPAYGRVIARYWNNDCAVADNGTSTVSNLAASYKLTDSSLRCSLYFVKQM